MLHHRDRHVACFHLPVDLVLHTVGMTDEVEVRLTVTPRGLDVEVAGADDAVDDPLVEVDVVDPLERDLDTVLGDHAGAVDHATTGDDEVRHPPLEVLQREPHRPQDQYEADDPVRDVLERAGVELEHEDQHDEQRDPGEDVPREVPPVGPKIQRQRLAFLDQVVGVRHGSDRTALRSPERAGSGPAHLPQAVVAHPEVVTDLVQHGHPHPAGEVGVVTRQAA